MSNRRQFNDPKIFSRDEIAALSDYDLDTALKDMSSTIKRHQRDGRDARHFEIEFCYLDNEKQRRMNMGAPRRPRQPKHDKRARSVNRLDIEPVKPREITNTHI
jgi:hypothetical protein